MSNVQEPEVTPALRAWLGRNLLGTAEIRARLGVSRQRTDQITAHRSFPTPVVELGAERIWLKGRYRCLVHR